MSEKIYAVAWVALMTVAFIVAPVTLARYRGSHRPGRRSR